MRARDYQSGEVVPGTVYKVVRLIGAGGMGTVYDVEDTTIGKRYVLKTLHPKLGAREDLARRIQNEARTLARLHHPNIVEVITAGVTADSLKLPYYLMERLVGQSLRVILEKKRQLDLGHAYHIAIDLLDALDHAHDKGVIHRDVKPDNIFLHRTNAGVTLTKLLDFGIVSMLDQVGETAGRFLGTLRYAAPEQLRGERPTVKTDVYAAGLVLYEMVAGRGPFDDEGDANRVAAAHIHKFPLPVSQFVAVPHALDVLLMAALAKNPEARPRDAFSFAASLRNLKRLTEEDQRQVPTENRATVPVVLAADSGATLPTPSPTSSQSASSSLAKTTLLGMPTPTREPSLDRTSPIVVTTTLDARDARDRAATTHTAGPDAVPSPREGTEVLPHLEATSLEDGQLGEVGTELQWPIERPPALSDEPQVRSLPAVASPRRRLVPLALALVGGAAVVALAIVTHRAIGHAAALSPGSTTTTAALVGTAASVAANGATEAAVLAPPAPPASSALFAPAAPPASSAPADATGAETAVQKTGPTSATAASTPPKVTAAARAKAPAGNVRPARAVVPIYADRPGPGF